MSKKEIQSGSSCYALLHKNREVAVPVLSAVVYGLYPVAAKIAYNDGANPAYLLVVTTCARALALIAFCILTNKSFLPSSRQFGPVISGGFFQAISIFGILGSLVYLPAPVTIVILFTHTILLLFFLAYRGEMKLTVATILTTLSALFGVSMVVDVWHHADHLPWIGVGLAFLAALATMSRLYVYGKQVREINPAVVGARMFSSATFFTLPLLYFTPLAGPSSFDGYGGVILCVLSLVLGTFGMFYGIALVGPFRSSLIIKCEPIFTALFSLLLLHESLNSFQYAGMALVIGSLVTYQYFDSRMKRIIKESEVLPE